MSTDEELIKEIQSGNQYAMEILVKNNYKLLFSFIYRHIGDYHTSYDITQEVLIKLVKSIKSYKDEGKFKNWLLRIAANTCNDYFRSSGAIKNKSNIELNTNIIDKNSNVYEIMSRKIERQKIKNAITTLPEFQRNAIILKYYHDLKIKDIAYITQSNESTVKSRLKQGIGKLKQVFERSEKNEKSAKESYR
ncbi:RNA polymerase sigma factor [Clostridium sp. CM028]|uniref:RNA polymerase sigma factor n=1 Tax=Clostridium sp. CM028 TaxID=2851575 RepID=UPI001C6F0C25|nr:RNA polymerase sigma factor [Clostridium sp. CM028]MBW9148864.1 RNA polymerase sigma factor [Clostridium sp. CM028]WLC63033.1 RNA polymerase sigma factor [Clostridium sp. CM028]